MFKRYRLKALEYLFYVMAGIAAVELIRIQSTQPDRANDLIAIIFMLVGTGILLPRIIAYARWQTVTAKVSAYKSDWDGDRSASYSYEFRNQTYRGSIRSLHGGPTHSSLQVSVNPSAPSVKYAVLGNVWFVGAAMLGVGIFVILSEQNIFG